MTRVSNPYPSYRDNALKWHSRLPKHWETHRLKTCVTNIIDITGEREFDDIYIALENVESWTGKIVNMDFGTVFESQVKRFQPNDVLFGKLRPYLAKSTRPSRSGVCVGEFLVLRPCNNNILSSYLEILLRSKSVVDTIDASTSGAKMPRADWQFIGNLRFPFPPVFEQNVIVHYLDHVCGRVDSYIDTKERLIALLKERKQAIIDSTVTHGLDPDVLMKPTGIGWILEIPAHWEVRRLRNVADMRVSNVDKHVREGETSVRLCNYVDVYKNDYIDGRIKFMEATATVDEIEQFRLEKGDVLITKDSETWDDIGVPALVTQGASNLISGYHLALLRTHTDTILGGYLFRALQSANVARQFHVVATGVTRYGLSHADIKSIFLPIPPISEQIAIVEYLDQVTAALDTAIDRTRRQIDLLREYRERLIDDVVTGKLDVREAHVDTGSESGVVEWAEETPLNRISTGAPPFLETRLPRDDPT